MNLSDSIVKEVCDIAIKAGKAILEVYDTKFTVDYKEDHSPLTLADRRSNEIIAEGLQKISAYPILSEETKQAPYSERKNWKTLWIVDPLDGTKEFIKHNGEFTVNIALVDEGKPVFGVIYVPVKEQLYYAIKGRGTFLIENGKTVKLPNAKRKENELIIVASRSHLSPETENYIEQSKIQHPTSNISFLSSGSSIKFCLVAEGKADVYPRFAPTMEWDTAAGHIIAEETSKKVLKYPEMIPLKYNKEDLLNPWFVVV